MRGCVGDCVGDCVGQRRDPSLTAPPPAAGIAVGNWSSVRTSSLELSLDGGLYMFNVMARCARMHACMHAHSPPQPLQPSSGASLPLSRDRALHYLCVCMPADPLAGPTGCHTMATSARRPASPAPSSLCLSRGRHTSLSPAPTPRSSPSRSPLCYRASASSAASSWQASTQSMTGPPSGRRLRFRSPRPLPCSPALSSSLALEGRSSAVMLPCLL